jgi:hypothetical protein
MDRPQGLSAARIAALAAAAVSIAAGPAAQRDVAAVAGVWELSLDNSHRKCPLTLSPEAGGVGGQLRFPAGCRRALPIVNGMAGWLVDGGAVRLIDQDGRPVLQFAASDDPDRLSGRTEAGEGYVIERKSELRLARAVPPPPEAPPAPALGVPQLTPVDPEKAPPLAAVPGVYVVDRYIEKDVCRVDLGRGTLTAAGRHEIRLLEGCRDAGLAAFDPVSWRYEGGRLTLTARRGHEVTLISERQGHWRRDPEVGAMLVLRKVTQ